MYYLTAEASFDSAHFLKDHAGKCANLHGHRWRIVAKIAGEGRKQDGLAREILIDFPELKRELPALADAYDHRLQIEAGRLKDRTLAALADEGLALTEISFRPTAEALAKEVYGRLCAEGFPVASVTIHETPDNAASYEETGV